MARLLFSLLLFLLSLHTIRAQWGRELGNMGMMDMGMGEFGMGGYMVPSFRRSSPTQQTKSKGLNLGGMGAMYGPGMGMMGRKK
ncbi:hypothetical protein PRIPAC_76500 [Pristionchus pacificus]|uniref:Uncharacterized protein n=1 Tax=Pristionchus pacificus TaxID=54126 RepID=A0A2A6CS95_PRIPA|nr:hypothetical protein PRIPAC_76500 [Pristionchus pacificus]|eukprot:PDM81084.1 hypothetical protein PRIPAC_36087 [Pristionchus pacificus]